MTDAVPIEEPVPPVPEAVAEVEAAPPEAAVPASAEVPAAALFEIEHPIGPVRQGVLDHLVDSEGPQTVAQIIAGLGNYSRGTIESAIKREFDAGRIERVAPGTYRLAPPRPAEPPKPAPPSEPEQVRSDGHTAEAWLAALDAYFTAPSSWPVEKLGPPPGARDNVIPVDIRLRFNERVRKREQRRKEAEAALARQAAADAELRNQLLAACNGNYSASLQVDDLAPVREALKVLPLDRVVMVVRQKVDRRCYPANPPLASWRDPIFLRALAEEFCRAFAIPGLVKEWGAAGKPPAAKVQSSPPAGEMPDDNIDRSHHDSEHAPPGPHSLPGAAPPAPDMSREAASASEPSPAVSVTPEQENSSTVPPAQPDRIPDGIPTTAYVAPTRESVLAAFARNRTPPPPAPQPRPAQPQPRPPERLAEPEPISDEGWEELIAGFMAGMVNWNVRRLGPEPGQPGCRAPRNILRSFGL